jgi:hypothetical protein
MSTHSVWCVVAHTANVKGDAPSRSLPDSCRPWQRSGEFMRCYQAGAEGLADQLAGKLEIGPIAAARSCGATAYDPPAVQNLRTSALAAP